MYCWINAFHVALPYVKNPAADPTFETFFTKQWTDNYMISLHNFLATTFQHMRKWSFLLYTMILIIVYISFTGIGDIEHGSSTA